MRKEWMEPVIEVQEFVANEYVASCGDKGMVYKFECTAGDKNLGPFNYPYAVYIDSNSNGKFDPEIDEYLSKYHACGVAHEAPVNDAFLSGFMIDTRRNHDHTPLPVIIWRGEQGNNTHCTNKLNISSWATAKS